MSMCMTDAIATALKEAADTPLVPGTLIGHTNFDKYGRDTATLVSIDGNTATVTMTQSGDSVTMETEGLVSIERFQELTEQYMMETVQQLQTVRKLEQALFGDSNGASDIDFGGPDMPTPGCDCEHCATFTPEQHAEAAAKAKELGLTF